MTRIMPVALKIVVSFVSNIPLLFFPQALLALLSVNVFSLFLALPYIID